MKKTKLAKAVVKKFISCEFIQKLFINIFYKLPKKTIAYKNKRSFFYTYQEKVIKCSKILEPDFMLIIFSAFVENYYSLGNLFYKSRNCCKNYIQKYENKRFLNKTITSLYYTEDFNDSIFNPVIKSKILEKTDNDFLSFFNRVICFLFFTKFEKKKKKMVILSITQTLYNFLKNSLINKNKIPFSHSRLLTVNEMFITEFPKTVKFFTNFLFLDLFCSINSKSEKKKVFLTLLRNNLINETKLVNGFLLNIKFHFTVHDCLSVFKNFFFLKIFDTNFKKISNNYRDVILKIIPLKQNINEKTYKMYFFIDPFDSGANKNSWFFTKNLENFKTYQKNEIHHIKQVFRLINRTRLHEMNTEIYFYLNEILNFIDTEVFKKKKYKKYRICRDFVYSLAACQNSQGDFRYFLNKVCSFKKINYFGLNYKSFCFRNLSCFYI